jgi:hypothetical protein
MRSTPQILVVSAVLAAATPTASQVLEVATLNTDQIRGLDRLKTVVILPGGILEQHGATDWPGYSGAPRHATSAVGAASYQEESRHFIDRALKAPDGQEPPAARRYADTIVGDPVIRGIVKDSQADEAARESRQRDWLARQPAWPPPGEPDP